MGFRVYLWSTWRTCIPFVYYRQPPEAVVAAVKVLSTADSGNPVNILVSLPIGLDIGPSINQLNYCLDHLSNTLPSIPLADNMPSFLTPNRHPYSARFSPHHPNLIAVAASQFYGFAGGGSLYVLELDDLFNVALIERKKYEWTDGLFDVVSLIVGPL